LGTFLNQTLGRKGLIKPKERKVTPRRRLGSLKMERRLTTLELVKEALEYFLGRKGS